MNKSNETPLVERINNFLRQCSPHMHDRDWYKLLAEARAVLAKVKGEA